MSRFGKIALLTVAVIVVVAVGARMLGGNKPQAPGQEQAAGAGPGKGNGKGKPDTGPVPVTVVEARQQEVAVHRTALGTVSAMNTVTVSPQVGGQLLSLHFKEGQLVRKGDLLAQIDPRTAQAAYDQAVAAKRQNEALLATARANFQRSSSPEYRQYVSQTDLDTQRNQVAQYESAVAANAASMRAAQVELQYTRVTAPITGVAGIRNVDAGNIVSAGTALVTLTQVQPIHVLFNLPERELGAVRQARNAGKVPVQLSERGGNNVLASDGELDVVDNQISTDSGTFRARAVFPNADGTLWPGQFANVRLQLGTIDSAVVIPAEAVQRGPNGDFVYVVDGDVVRQQTVTVGIEVDDRNVQVSEGLKGGEKVVTEGQFRLKPGAKVIALAPGQAPPPPPEEKAGDKDKKGGKAG